MQFHRATIIAELELSQKLAMCQNTCPHDVFFTFVTEFRSFNKFLFFFRFSSYSIRIEAYRKAMEWQNWLIDSLFMEKNLHNALIN